MSKNFNNLFNMYQEHTEFAEVLRKIKENPNSKLSSMFAQYSKMILDETEIRYDFFANTPYSVPANPSVIYFNCVCEVILGIYKGYCAELEKFLNADQSDWNEKYALKHPAELQAFSFNLREEYCKVTLKTLHQYLDNPQVFMEEMILQGEQVDEEYNRIELLLKYLLQIDEMLTLIEKGKNLFDGEDWRDYKEFLPLITLPGKNRDNLANTLNEQLASAEEQVKNLKSNVGKLNNCSLDYLTNIFDQACNSYNKTNSIIDDSTKVISSVVAQMGVLKVKLQELEQIINSGREIQNDPGVAVYSEDIAKILTPQGQTLSEELLERLSEAENRTKEYSVNNERIWTFSAVELDKLIVEVEQLCKHVQNLLDSYKTNVSVVIAQDSEKISKLWERIAPSVPQMSESFIELKRGANGEFFHRETTAYPCLEHMATLQFATLFHEQLDGNPFVLSTLKKAHLVTYDTKVVLLVDSGYDIVLSEAQLVALKVNFDSGNLSEFVFTKNAFEKLKKILK